MDCLRVQENIYDLIENRLSDQQRREMTAHIDNCPQCTREYKIACKLNELYASQPQQPLPKGFYERLQAKLPVENRKEKPAGNSWLKSLSNLFGSLGISRGFAYAMAGLVLVLIGVAFLAGRYLPMPGEDASLVSESKAPRLTLAYGDGPVELYDVDKKTWKTADKATVLKTGDLMKTQQGNVVVMIDSANNIRLAPETEVKVEKIARGKEKLQSRLILEKGRVWVQEKKVAAVQVETDRYLIDPVGTSYEVKKEDDGSTSVSCYEGSVKILLKETGKTIELNYGESFLSQPKTPVESGTPLETGYRREIEKINAEKLENDQWFNWNCKVDTPGLPNSDYPLSRPRFRKRAAQMPQWYSSQRGNLQGGSLSLPQKSGDWKQFRERKKQWRKRFMKRRRGGSGDSGIPSPPSQPGTTRGPGQGNRGVTPDSQPDGGADPFSRLPAERRKMIIQRMKNRGVLPSTYPDDSTQLPPEVMQQMRRQMNRNRGGGNSGNSSIPRLPDDGRSNSPGANSPNRGGGVNNSRPGTGADFNNMPTARKRMMIRGMKKRGVLPEDYPDDSTVLPDDVKKNMRGGPRGGFRNRNRKMMRNRRRSPGNRSDNTNSGGSVPGQLQNNEE